MDTLEPDKVHYENGDRMEGKRRHKRLKIALAIVGAVIIVMIIAMAVYFSTYDHSVDVDEDLTDSETVTESEAITEDEAQDIAIADSGLSESEIKYINIWTEKEDGQWLYAVEFGTYDDTEYKYEIDMYTGEIAASYIESH